MPAALESLANQPVDWQAIVVDGGSTDDTPRIARDWPRVAVISAPGTSIYAALNIGIGATAAPYVFMLNADDMLVPGALGTLVDTHLAAPSTDIVRGRAKFFADTAEEMAYAAATERKADQPLSFNLITRGPVSINTMLFRHTVFERVGAFDERWRFAADREWLLRAWKAETRWIELVEPVYRYRVHPGSSTLDPRARLNFARIREEHLAIIEKFRGEFENSSAVCAGLLTWHAVEVALIARDAARHRDWGKLASAFRRGFHGDPLWLARVAGEVLHRRW